MDLKFELLKASKEGDKFRIIGTMYSDELNTDEHNTVLRASMFTIEKVKQLLAEGKEVFLPEISKFVEYQIDELIVTDNQTELDIAKNKYLIVLNNKLRNILVSIKFLDMFRFMNSYMVLLNSGIYITDQNRNDVYMDIFNKYATVEEPEPISDDTTFEEAKEYIKKKDEYTKAKEILTNLETYMNEYENILSISNINNVLQEAEKAIRNCQTIEEFNKVSKEYDSKINDFNILT